jgi:hypothetical protein
MRPLPLVIPAVGVVAVAGDGLHHQGTKDTKNGTA